MENPIVKYGWFFGVPLWLRKPPYDFQTWYNKMSSQAVYHRIGRWEHLQENQQNWWQKPWVPVKMFPSTNLLPFSTLTWRPCQIGVGRWDSTHKIGDFQSGGGHFLELPYSSPSGLDADVRVGNWDRCDGDFLPTRSERLLNWDYMSL